MIIRNNNIPENPNKKEVTVSFESELGKLINSYCIENASDTPDFILAGYMLDCLDAFNTACNKRTRWYRKMTIEEEK